MPPAAGTQTRRITINVDASGARGLEDMASKLGGINKNTKELAQNFSGLSAAGVAFLGGLGVRQLSGFSDEIQNLNNRLRALTGNQELATQTLSALVGVARETNQSLEAVSQGYFRMGQALNDAGISQATLIDLTKTIANTFRLAGASTEEAANATVQLGQAFSLGVLRGQDLRSVMSQNVVLTRLLRKEFGNDLLKSAEKGLITVPKLMEILHKNMEEVNKTAKGMSTTFEQSITKALDAAKLKIFEVSESIGASSAFATAIDWATKHMGQLGTVAAILAFGTVPALVASLYGLLTVLGLVNSLSAGLVLGLGAVTAIFGEKFEITTLITQLKAGFSELQAKIDDSIASFYELADAATHMLLVIAGTPEKYTKLAKAARDAAADHRAHAKALWIEQEAQDALREAQIKGGDSAKRWADDINKAHKAFDRPLDPKQELARLNAEFKSGKIDLSEYQAKILDFDMYKMNYQVKEGEKNIAQLHDMQRKVELFKLNRQFKDGAIDIQQYNAAANAVSLDNLKEDLQAGTLSLSDFNSKLAGVSSKFSTGGAFRTGLQDYLTSIGTTTQAVAGVIKNAFSDLENVFLEFTKNGKLNFDKFTEAILDDLTRIIFRATIIQPLATGILNGLNTPTTTSGTVGGGGGQYPSPNLNAHGNVYDITGLRKFATGGVVSSPTVFAYGKGNAGLMGEAGPEAILPLKRGSGGDLGVKASITPVTVNIINQSGNEVKQTETTGPSGEKVIEVLITSKVREGIASGKYDKVFKQAYGMNRRGS